MPEFNGTPRGQGRRCAVVVSRFNEMITQRLLEGALDALVRHGVAFDDVDVFWVPGAWELPGAASTETKDGTRRSPGSRWRISSIRSMARRRTETRARSRALQALYAWDVRGERDLERVAERVWEDLAVGGDERRVAG